jgi:hypothetical protein
MKITTFNPLIVTKDSAPLVELFEALGFEKRHNLKASTGEKAIDSIRMKNEAGFYVDISEVEDFALPQDLTLIRMNVDNFDEAYEKLKSMGFVNPRGDDTVDTKSNKSAMLRSPSGFGIDLCQHIKDHD